MKTVFYALILILLASCNKQRSDANMKLVAQEFKEIARILSLTSFEKAIEGVGYESLVTAFIVRKGEDGLVATARELYRRAPSDPEEYVPASLGPGNYLVGTLMPIGGYSLCRPRDENRFCISVTDDGEFAYGVGVSQLHSIRDIKAKIDRTSQQAVPPNGPLSISISFHIHFKRSRWSTQTL